MDKHAHWTSRHLSRNRSLATAAALALLAVSLIRAEEAGGNAAQPATHPGRLTGSVAAGRPSREEELKNVVIYLEPAPQGVAARSGAAARPVMKQEGLTFVPHVLPVLKGSTVEFPNEDPIFHNVFSLSKASSFDLGRYPQGASKSVRFD